LRIVICSAVVAKGKVISCSNVSLQFSIFEGNPLKTCRYLEDLSNTTTYLQAIVLGSSFWE
jgi:hypothetical protein